MNGKHRILIAATGMILVVIAIAACSATKSARSGATPTPTRTPRVSLARATQEATPDLSLPTATVSREPSPASAATAPATATDAPSPVPPSPTSPPSPTVQPVSATATRILPTAAPALDFVISELRVLGQGENNGGIEGPGAGRTIFISVVDAAGAPIDDAHIVNSAGYPGNARSGDKGPGKAEILMDREVFQLSVADVGGAPVKSETSHNISLIDPVPSDIVGKLGDACPTLDNCPLPPYKHFSYVITFRRTY